MRNLILLLGVITTISLSACRKDNNELNGHAQIRIVNNTALPLSDAVIGGEMYGSVAPSQTSVYHNFENIYYVPGVSFYDNKTLIELGIGYCGTPPLPDPTCLTGKYTYTIVQDNSNSLGFNFTFKED